jgi:iron complex transport system permease protein
LILKSETFMSAYSLTPRKTFLTTIIFFLLLLVASLISLSIGSVAIPFKEVIRFLAGGIVSEENRTILLSIRLPRILLAIIVGGGLSVAGVVFQALLRNPLAEPFILGVSSGGTLGAVIAITFGIGLSIVTIPAFAFVGSLIVMLVVYSISERYGRLEPTTLLLVGIMTGAFCNALILLMIALKHQEARGALLWLMGNLASAELNSLLIVAPIVLAAVVIIFLYSRNYNLIAFGEETAANLGLEVEKFKRISYLLASMITGLVVSVSGVIGFVGLLVPHICRMMFGSDHRLVVPVSFFMGAIFLVAVDMIARTIISPAEIPVGAVTAVVGAPLFVWMLRRSARI